MKKIVISAENKLKKLFLTARGTATTDIREAAIVPDISTGIVRAVSANEEWNRLGFDLVWKAEAIAPPGPPTYCPFCGGSELGLIDDTSWEITSRHDRTDPVQPISQWQCRSRCEGRSFFV